MLKFIINIVNKGKHILNKQVLPYVNKGKQALGKYVPNCVKNEYETMTYGVNNLRGRFSDNYFLASRNPGLREMTRLNAFQEKLGTALASTSITKKDIPSLFALTGGCSFPYPGTTEAGYIIGRLLTSKPATMVYNTGKKVCNGTYSTFNNILNL